MSLKQALFLTVLAFLAFITANNMCSCLDERTENEMEEFRKFLLNLPKENEQEYPVIPGEISTLVTCSDCIDRMKREIVKPKRFFKPYSMRRYPDVARNRCPLGYFRIAFMCIHH